jgi:hypothetical protein
MGLFKKIFGLERIDEDFENTAYQIDEERLKNLIAQEFNIEDDEALDRVVESIKSNIVKLDGESEGDVIDAFKEELDLLYTVNYYNRIDLCKKIDEFVKANPEVSNSVKLFASYIAYGASEINIEEYKVILVSKDEETKNTMFNLVQRFERNSKIKELVYRLAVDLVKYEDAFLEKIRNADGKVVSVKYLPSNTMLIKYDPKTGKPVEYIQVIDDTSIRFTDERRIFDEISLSFDQKTKIRKFSPEDIVHINNGTPIGVSDSPLVSMAILWKLLRILEESLVIHRLTRARRFIIFFVDVSGKTKKAIRRTIQSFTNMLKRVFRINVESGSLIGRNSSLQASMDLVIPITKDSATKVQTIPSDPSAVKIDDLKFYTNRLLTNFLTGWVFYPEKTGKEEIQKEAFIRMVKIYQKHFSYALTDLYKEYLSERGIRFVNGTDLRIQFPNPDAQSEVKVVDTIVRRMMVVNQITAILGVVPPIRWIVSYVFRSDLSQVEIEELVALIEEEIRKQEEKAKGQELPASFNTESASDVLSLIGAIPENSDKDFSPLDELVFVGSMDENEESVSEQSKFHNSSNIVDLLISEPNKVKKSQAIELTETRLKATQQAIELLKMINSKE